MEVGTEIRTAEELFGLAPKITLQECFKDLRGRDRRSLTDILAILKKHGLSEVIICGSCLDGARKRRYGDIDLLVEGDLTCYRSALEEIKELGQVYSEQQTEMQGYCGTIVKERKGIRHGKACFDISFDYLGQYLGRDDSSLVPSGLL